MGHPAHYHLFKNVIQKLQEKGHRIHILIKKKDILENLLQSSELKYENILPKGRKDSKLGLLIGILQRSFQILTFSMFKRFDLFIGTSVDLPLIGKLLNIPVINVNEDDASAVPLYAKLAYPFSSIILSPESCCNDKWEHKSIKYQGYHELAYLHPNHFIPQKKVVEKYFFTEAPFFIIRLAQLTAHHDSGVQGINKQFAEALIKELIPYGNVYISSERTIEPEFEQYRIPVDPMDMHHVLAFAKLYIGDSQTMAAESGVLGTPFIRINDFVGRIGYLKEMEETFQLGYGVRPKDKEKIFDILNYLLTLPDIKIEFQKRRKRMLLEKIDVAEFMIWFIENYPKSIDLMKDDPKYKTINPAT